MFCLRNGSAGTSNITFLAGTEALDETVGGVKIQLAPKTNFWCNASGVEQLGAAVGDMLSPLQKTTVIEIGCGLGLIGLMVASVSANFLPLFKKAISIKFKQLNYLNNKKFKLLN